MAKKAPVAQLDRALASGARGHRFKSCRVYQIIFNMYGLQATSCKLQTVGKKLEANVTLVGATAFKADVWQ